MTDPSYVRFLNMLRASNQGSPHEPASLSMSMLAYIADANHPEKSTKTCSFVRQLVFERLGVEKATKHTYRLTLCG